MNGRDAGFLWAALLLVAVAGAGWWLLEGSDGKAPGVVESGEQPRQPEQVERPGQPERPEGLQPLTPTPARTGRAPVSSEEGPAPSIVDYVVVNARTAQPIEGAAVRLAAGGRRVGTTDAAGAVTVGDYGLADLVFTAPGFLLAFYPFGFDASAMAAEAEGRGNYVVRLEPDLYTIPLTLRFVSSEGAAPEWVRFRLRAEVEQPALGVIVPRERLGPEATIDRELPEIWRHHALMSGLAGFEALPYHFGGNSSQRVYRASAEVTVRFAASGDYHLRAVSSDGEVAQRTVRVTLGHTSPLVIELASGVTMKGVVTSAAGGAVVGARVRPASPLVGVGVVKTGAAGEFELGPVSDDPIELQVAHHDFESKRTPPRRPTAPPQAVVLLPRVPWTVRGVVRAPPELTPVDGAEVAIVWPCGHAVRVDTGPDGRFSCVTTADEAEIVIRAEGYRVYAELLVRPSAPETYDLLPASASDRVRAGLTAMVRGEVRGPDGRPRPGMTVRLIPKTPARFPGQPGRRITRGATLLLPDVAIADDQGVFRLECLVDGLVRLVPEDGISQPEDGEWIDVRRGAFTGNLQLRARR